MKKISLPVGRSGFADIRVNGYYYIDKSRLIEKLLETDGIQATLITRPRRFGKTLGMNMLAEFFDIRKNSRALFEGLAVAENTRLCDNWMNRFPTVFLSFRTVDGLKFESAYEMLAAVLAEVCNEHFYLLDSDIISDSDKETFHRIVFKKASQEEVKSALAMLTKMLAAYYGRPVILLIDEYDVPLAKASEKGYYAEMLDVIRGVMQVVKDNNALKLSVITGCLRIAKESIFTGTNNMVSDTISDTRLNEYFGFTQDEVDRLLADTELTAHREEIRKWYDGYRFGSCDVYCPWDVINHVNNLILNPETKPAGYWNNSSDNAIIRSFIDYSGDAITQKFETLLSGGYIIQNVKEDLTYNYLHSSEENLWSILYLTGYLTRVRDNSLLENLPRGVQALRIPNVEVMEIFETTIATWFEESTRLLDRKTLFAALWSGDAQTATTEVSRLLRRTISYHDYREDFYHAFFAGIFAGAGYVVESNREHGDGRSDIVVKDYAGDRAVVFEVKYAKNLKSLEKACDLAISQIDEKKYAEDLEDDYARVICYGIAFFKKRCVIRKK